MEREDFVLRYCSRLTEILHSQETIERLSDKDYELCSFIHEHESIDSCTLPEKTRTDMEVWIYSECNRFVDRKFQSGKAFDIGNGIESIEAYFNLLKKFYQQMYKSNIPDTLVNVKDLIIVRLKMIEISSSSDRAMLLHKNKLENVVDKYKCDLDREIEKNRLEVSEELNDTLKTVNQSLSEVEVKKTDIYKDIITIISIFAGIILTFSGAFSFSSAMLGSITVANFYKLIVASSLICIFLLSLFVGLYFFVYNIRYNHPLSDDKLSATNDKKDIKRIKKGILGHRLSLLIPVIAAYVVLTGIIAMVLFSYPDELSKDDSKAQNDSAISETQQETEDKNNTFDDNMTDYPTSNTDS